MTTAEQLRAHLVPRPVSQTWLDGAVGTAVWTGVRLREVLADAGPAGTATGVVLQGADHGLERGVEQDYARGLSLADATRPEVLLAYELNGAPLAPQHGFPLRVAGTGGRRSWSRRSAALPGPAGPRSGTRWRATTSCVCGPATTPVRPSR